MPELPEVEAYTRFFTKHATGKTISRVKVLDERVVGSRNLPRALKGRKFGRVRRHGKHLFASAGNAWLHLHFGMSGDLSTGEPRFTRVLFEFEDGSRLAFEDMRLFGVVEMVPSPEQYIETHHLGPDPLDKAFDLERFRALVRNRRGAVKSLLMSQEIIAGVGNLYADEMLYQTGIHPRRAVSRLSTAQVRALHKAIKHVLHEAVSRRVRGREVPGAWLFHHREEGDRCPRCDGTIRRTVVFGRTTYFCAKHQRS